MLGGFISIASAQVPTLGNIDSGPVPPVVMPDKTGIISASDLPLIEKPPLQAAFSSEKVGTVDTAAQKVYADYTESEKLLKLKAEGVTSMQAGALYLDTEKVAVTPAVAMETVKLGTKAEISDVVLVNKDQGEDKVPVYEVSTAKEARLLGLFKVQVLEKVSVDGTTGSITETKKPWWSWLSF